MTKARKPIADLVGELRNWLSNYDAREKDSYPQLLFRILASAPGGDELEDMGYEPFRQMGWHELDQLGRVLEAIQDKQDVEELVRGLVAEEEEDEPEEATIAQIKKAYIRTYPDSGQVTAYVEFIDSNGQSGRTEGEPNGAHMKALLARARREGIKVEKEEPAKKKARRK